jgi:hypothetical protein
VASNQQMRDAWARRSDDELLSAFLIDDLSPAGAELVETLVVERFGSIELLVADARRQLGDIAANVVALDCIVNARNARSTPALRGLLSLTSTGLGFLGHARESNPVADLLGVASRHAGGLARMVLGEYDGLTKHMGQRKRANWPLPLLARVDSTTFWFERAEFSSIQLGDRCFVCHDDDILLSFEYSPQLEEALVQWTESVGLELF